jgi:hypothetical protein
MPEVPKARAGIETPSSVSKDSPACCVVIVDKLCSGLSFLLS